MSSDAEIQRLLMGGGSDPVADAIKAGKKKASTTAVVPPKTTTVPVIAPPEPAETPAQAAARKKAALLADLDNIRGQKVKGNASADQLKYLDDLRAKVAAGEAGADDSARNYLHQAYIDGAWDKGQQMLSDAFYGGFPEAQTDPATAQTFENLGIFGKGALSQAWDWTKGAWEYASTQYPVATKLAGGLLGGLMLSRALAGVLENSVGKIPIIGGLLTGILSLVVMVGGGLLTANIMTNMGVKGSAQTNSGGQNIPPALRTTVTSSTDDKGSLTVPKPDASTTYDAGQGNGGDIPLNTMTRDGPHVPDSMRTTTLRYDRVPSNDLGPVDSQTVTYTANDRGGYSPDPSAPSLAA